MRASGQADDVFKVQPSAKPTVSSVSSEADYCSSGCAGEPPVVAVVVPADEPDEAKEGTFNLILSRANVETSLLACV